MKNNIKSKFAKLVLKSNLSNEDKEFIIAVYSIYIDAFNAFNFVIKPLNKFELINNEHIIAQYNSKSNSLQVNINNLNEYDEEGKIRILFHEFSHIFNKEFDQHLYIELLHIIQSTNISDLSLNKNYALLKYCFSFFQESYNEYFSSMFFDSVFNLKKYKFKSILFPHIEDDVTYSCYQEYENIFFNFLKVLYNSDNYDLLICDFYTDVMNNELHDKISNNEAYIMYLFSLLACYYHNHSSFNLSKDQMNKMSSLYNRILDELKTKDHQLIFS